MGTSRDPRWLRTFVVAPIAVRRLARSMLEFTTRKIWLRSSPAVLQVRLEAGNFLGGARGLDGCRAGPGGRWA